MTVVTASLECVTDAAAPPREAPCARGVADTALRDALLDSRGRWRELVAMAADLAFETDAAGRFVFITPDPAIGWPASALIGQRAETLLLAVSDADSGFNPFHPPRPMRRR